MLQPGRVLAYILICVKALELLPTSNHMPNIALIAEPARIGSSCHGFVRAKSKA